jgi:lysophospholipase L1-like esterase
MKATNGFVASFVKRGRVIGGCAALALALSAMVFAMPASAVEPPPPTTYLALGDSIAFGYTQVKFVENFPNLSPSYFEEGYDNFYAQKVRINKLKLEKNLVIVNDGCPGETSSGLVGHNPALGGFEYVPTGTETPEEIAANEKKQAEHNPCAYHYTNQLPLHNGGYYNPKTGKPVSQLEETFSTLTTENKVTKATPAHPMTAISLNIGGNDELAGVHDCEKEVGEEFAKTGKSQYGDTPEHAVSGCLVAHAPALFEKIKENIGHVLAVIDSTGYTGPIAVVGFYNPDSFLLPGSDVLTAILNKEVESKVKEFANAKYANPFAVFNPQPVGPETTKSKEAEEKAICRYTEMCNPIAQALHEAEAKKALPPHDGDIHPSRLGYQEIAKLMFAVAPA